MPDSPIDSLLTYFQLAIWTRISNSAPVPTTAATFVVIVKTLAHAARGVEHQHNVDRLATMLFHALAIKLGAIRKRNVVVLI